MRIGSWLESVQAAGHEVYFLMRNNEPSLLAFVDHQGTYFEAVCVTLMHLVWLGLVGWWVRGWVGGASTHNSTPNFIHMGHGPWTVDHSSYDFLRDQVL